MIETVHLAKSYRKGRPVLRDVNIVVEGGEFVFLTGASGAGKTTLFKLFTGQQKPDSGEVRVLGRDVPVLGRRGLAALRRRIGIVFQDARLLPNLTVAENVSLGVHVDRRPARDVALRVAKALDAVGLLPMSDELPPALSSGEQQRAALARALINDPEVLLADEPTGNLDEERTKNLLRLMLNANARGTTVLLATHDSRLYEGTRRRVLALADGKLITLTGGAA